MKLLLRRPKMFDKEFEFKGKHAGYVRFLKDEIGLFKTYREAYTISAIVGFLNANKALRDSTEKVQPASVLPGEMVQKRTELTLIYRLMMLLDNVDDFTIDDYKNRAFRDDADVDEHPEKFKNNMELFNSYVLGGLEIIYDKFQACNDKSSTVNMLYDYLMDFFEDNNLI